MLCVVGVLLFTLSTVTSDKHLEEFKAFSSATPCKNKMHH